MQIVLRKTNLEDDKQKTDQFSSTTLSCKMDARQLFCDACTGLVASWLKGRIHVTAEKCGRLQKLPQNFKLNT